MKVLFICTANVCRSPLAEGYLKYLIQERGVDLDSSSAGIAAFTGAPPFECAVDVAEINDFDISSHRARQLTPEIGFGVDRILCMETWQAKAVMEMDPKLSAKVTLLGRYHPSGENLLQIPDPKDFNVPETLRVFELIRESVEGLLQSISSSSIARKVI